jgi:hypothetical protein
MDIRDVLFGDLPAERWPEEASTQTTGEPWSTFVQARDFAKSGHSDRAKQSLYAIVSMPGFESRHYLQAWSFLRALGEQPPVKFAKHLYGVVIEVALEEGVDIVAAYQDYTARYINYSGAGIFWEHPNDSLDSAIDDLLSAGRLVVEKIGPWEGPRPQAPPAGEVRLNLLTPLGLHFGQATYTALSSDPLGGPVLNAGFKLMQALIAAGENG